MVWSSGEKVAEVWRAGAEPSGKALGLALKTQLGEPVR